MRNSQMILTATFLGTAAGICSYVFGRKANPRAKKSQCIANGMMTGVLTAISIKYGLNFFKDREDNATDLAMALVFGTGVVAYQVGIAEETQRIL